MLYSCDGCKLQLQVHKICTSRKVLMDCTYIVLFYSTLTEKALYNLRPIHILTPFGVQCLDKGHRGRSHSSPPKKSNFDDKL